MKVQTNTGITLTGRDSRALVRALRNSSFSPAESLEDFMAEVAARAKEQTGKEVRTSSPAVFIHDLQTAGLLLEPEEGESDEEAH